MDGAALESLRELINTRNAIDAKIGGIIGRPALAGHIGEWIASQVFDLDLNPLANAKGIDAYFRSGNLAGLSINIKFYSRRAGIIDLRPTDGPEYYLVMTGPKSTARSSAGQLLPMRIDAVYLVHAATLISEMASRGRRVGVASSVRDDVWDRSEIYPRSLNAEYEITGLQREVLAGFSFSAVSRSGAAD